MHDEQQKTTQQELHAQLLTFEFISGRAAEPSDAALKVGDNLLVWDTRIDGISRRLRKVQTNVQRVVTMSFGVLAFFSLALFVVTAFASTPPEMWISGAFWTSPSMAQLWFWITILFVLHVIYRQMRIEKIRVLPIWNPTEEAVLAPSAEEWLKASRSHTFSVWDSCTEEARDGLNDAGILIESYRHTEIGALQIFSGQLSQSSIGHVFLRLGIRFEQMKDPLARKLNALPRAENPQPVMTEEGHRVVLGAAYHALMHGRKTITPVDFFVVAYRNSEFLQELFYDLGVDEEMMENVLAWLQIREQLRERWLNFSKAAWLKPTGTMNRAMTSVQTPLLDRVSSDLTVSAASGALPMLIGREDEMSRILRVFEGGRRSVVLVGPRGVGKEAVVHGLAQRMVEERVPKLLQDRRLVQLDVARLIAGGSATDAEGRLLQALYEVGQSGNIALVIPNIDDIVGVSSGGKESLDLSSVLASEIEKGYFVAITTTTPGAYRTAIEGTALGSVLTKVDVGEPNKNEAIRVLAANVGRQEAKHQVLFSYGALEACVALSARYIHDQMLPEKALRVMEEVALLVRQEKGEGQIVDKDDVARVVSTMSKVPVSAVSQDEKQKLLNLEDVLHERVIGQDEAVRMVSAALRRARTELRSGKRPIANFLFLGPTGVGKTELAKTVAEVYFGSEDTMIRLDMSEYQEASSVNRLLGVPGSGEGGIFTEAVRAQPFALVLLDELEKAHPDILNLFLQVFDDGRLTDAAGRTVDFTQTIIVATSNVGSQKIQDGIRNGLDVSQIKTQLIEEDLAGVYRPEFLNRFDGMVVFTPLSVDAVTRIAELMLGGVEARLEEKGIAFEVTDAALKELAAAGYDPQYGARPMRRAIQERVEDPIATILLEEKAGRRDKIVLEAGGQMRVEHAGEL